MMGDSRRFDVFAQYISTHFPPSRFVSIADVAGGKGALQLALTERGYTATTFDRRNKRQRGRGVNYQYRYFDKRVKDHFDLIVGMHPDEATDIIIVEACRRGVPFAVVPCCVMPAATVMWTAYKYHNWLKHLVKEARQCGYNVTQDMLHIQGRNIVLRGDR